jgi:hypothetical protein
METNQVFIVYNDFVIAKNDFHHLFKMWFGIEMFFHVF